MAYKNTDYSTSMRGDVTPIKSVMYRTENNIARPYFMRKVEQSGPDYTEPFYVKDLSGSDNTLSITQNNSDAPAITVETSTDRVTWTTLGTTSTEALTATVPANGKLYIRGNGDWASVTGSSGASSPTVKSNKMTLSGFYEVGGNIMSLKYGSSFTGNERGYILTPALFKESTTLKAAKELLMPSTTLSDGCYMTMFYGCTSLVSAPELPCLNLLDYNCPYSSMFYGCSSLTKAPKLVATDLGNGSYFAMFQNCTSLNYIYCAAKNRSYTTNQFTNFMYGVPKNGYFEYADPTINCVPEDTGGHGRKSSWETNLNVDKKYSTYFYIEDLSGEENTFTQKALGYYQLRTSPIQYSYDTVTWSNMTSPSRNGTSSINFTGRLYLRSTRCSFYSYDTSSSGSIYYDNSVSFTCSKDYKIGGFLGSLIVGSEIEKHINTVYRGRYNYYSRGTSFYSLFKDSTTLKSIDDVIWPINLGYDGQHGSYSGMFQGCTGLTSVPDLPYTTLDYRCYQGMFSGCTSLTTAPALPVTTLKNYCYNQMFYNCTSLTTAPELPATTLAKSCYQSMFSGCTSLNYIKVHFTSWYTSDSQSYTKKWTMLTVNTTGTFVCPSSLPKFYNASGNNSDYTGGAGGNGAGSNKIPSGWTVQTF